MKTIKYLFIISLINFVLVLTVVNISNLFKSQNVEMSPIVPEVTSVPTTILTPTLSPTNTITPTKRITSPTVVTPTVLATPTPDPLAGRCIVTVSGSRYDVTDFRISHSGGDIFQCGTDMTGIFSDRHPSSYLNRMAQYKI